jgi:chaperonin GroES
MFNVNYISRAVALEFESLFSKIGTPSNNRVLILSPNEETTTASGIIIPDTVKEGKPRKGVVISKGAMDDDSVSAAIVEVGNIVTYGLYAGKDLEVNTSDFPEPLKNLLNKNTLTVLSISEIIYAEFNK